MNHSSRSAARPNAMPDILIITVNYRGAESTKKFLWSASQLDGLACAHFIVVENGSHDGSDAQLRPLAQKFTEESGNVELMESAENRGYFGAANWALRQYRARGCNPTWVIVCNNDVVFEDRQFLVKLLQRDPGGAQVIAPAIITGSSGIDCNPSLRRRPTRFRLFRYHLWYRHYYLMWFKQWLSPYVRQLRHLVASSWRHSSPIGGTVVYAPHGAFLIFSRSYFEAGGYIDDGFFLYAEEFSVAEICRRLQLRVLHDSDLRVWHDAHQVTGRMCNRESFEWCRQGFEYALNHYFRANSTPLARPARDQGAAPRAKNFPAE
jgi:GT2 family glycosyltransferase